MCKKIIISIVVTGVLWLGYYAISPLFKNVHVDDAFPENLIVDTKEVVSVVIPSGFEKLSEERQKDMLEEMKVVNETPMPRVGDSISSIRNRRTSRRRFCANTQDIRRHRDTI